MQLDTVSPRSYLRAVVIASVALAGCSPPRLASVSRADASPTHIVFRNVSVFDGVAMVPHQDVLVTGDEIAAVSQTGELVVPDETLELAGAGRTLLPGLVDSHVHLFSAGEKQGPPPGPGRIGAAFLYAGITSALVAAGFDEATELAEQQCEGRALAPRLFTAGSGLSAPGGHPIPLLRAMLPWPASWLATRSIITASDEAAARTGVARIITRDRPDFVKIVYDDLPPGSPHLSLDALRAAIAEARAQGRRSIVHATTPRDTMDAIDAGASLLVHVPQRGLLTNEQVARLVASGVPVVTTVRLVSATRELANDGPIPLERQMYGAELLQPWLDEPEWNLPGFSKEVDSRAAEVAADTAANFRKLHAAGMPMLVGTDSGVHGVFPGASLHREMRLLVELGMSPSEVLRAATSAPAAFLDPGRTFGRIASGQRADLLLVRGNPLDDIEALATIEEVLIGGVRLRRHGI